MVNSTATALLFFLFATAYSWKTYKARVSITDSDTDSQSKNSPKNSRLGDVIQN